MPRGTWHRVRQTSRRQVERTETEGGVVETGREEGSIRPGGGRIRRTMGVFAQGVGEFAQSNRRV